MSYALVPRLRVRSLEVIQGSKVATMNIAADGKFTWTIRVVLKKCDWHLNFV